MLVTTESITFKEHQEVVLHDLVHLSHFITGALTCDSMLLSKSAGLCTPPPLKEGAPGWSPTWGPLSSRAGSERRSSTKGKGKS